MILDTMVAAPKPHPPTPRRPAPRASAVIARALLGLGCSSAAEASTPVPEQPAPAAVDSLVVASPDGRNVVGVGSEGGRLTYRVRRDGRNVVLPSRLGFE